MGVIYKLNQEVKKSIVEEKRNNPSLSCRALVKIIELKYKIKVSKSSINALAKEAGLSLSVGRKPKKPIDKQQIKIEKKPIILKQAVPAKAREIIGLGAIFLKAADALIKGSFYITEIIKKSLGDQDLAFKTDCLIYKSLGTEWLSALAEARDKEDISSYLIALQQVRTLGWEIAKVVPNLLYPVRGIKFLLSDNSSFYVDSQWHTVWPTPNSPVDFSATICEIRNYIKLYFRENKPCVLFMASGDSYPSEEFFNFIMSSNDNNASIYAATIYGNKLEPLDHINMVSSQKTKVIFGLWPWQFPQYRKVIKTGDFKIFNLDPFNTAFYIADIEIELRQPIVNKSVTLRGVALKTNPGEKIKLVILSNIKSTEQLDVEELATIYLRRWPNLEECLSDLNRKVEFLAYGDVSESLSTAKFDFDGEAGSDITALLNLYLKGIDLYVKRFFLPIAYRNADFSTVNERFYKLPALLSKVKNEIIVRFVMPAGYKFQPDLEYACRRVNEREVVLPAGQRIWLKVD